MSDISTFAAPGPGGWDLDRSHYFGGTTAISQWLMEHCCEAGMRRAFTEFGIPADTFQARFVHGFMYTRLRPLVAPNKPATKAPPILVLKVASRLHPEFRRRSRQAAKTLAERPWRAVAADWVTTLRPQLETANLAFQDVDLSGLEDLALAGHVVDLLAHLRRTFEQHFYLHAFDLGPIGLLLFEARAWGLTAQEVIPALEGASPSTGEPARALARIRALIPSTGPRPTSIAELRAVSAELTDALDDYLRLRGWIMFSRYDLEGLTLHEAPEVLLATVLHGAEQHQGGADRAQAASSALRARVPEAWRARFDELLGEARAAMNLRDDNGPNTVEWPVGLLRRGLLEAGRRLAGRDRIELATDMFELNPEEVAAMIGAGDGPSGVELVERRGHRLANAQLAPPAHLGPVEVDPPLSALPAPLATMVGVVNAVRVEMGMTAAAPTAGRGGAHSATLPGRGLHGVGVGAVSYEGRARVALSPEDAFTSMEPGDVLVVRATSPAYNTVLSLAGAVVTADGGPLCHAAVLARELGIPGVIGAAGALEEIPDGAIIRVDPAAGRVTVLS